MIELYDEVLTDGRLHERKVPLVGLVTILYNTGYESEMDLIHTFLATNDGLQELTAQVENNIFTSVRSLLIKLGVDISIEDVYQYPMDTYNLLITILEEIENYEDYESLVNIVDSGEPPTIVLADLTTFIVGDTQNVLQEIIVSVTDALMRVIRSSLTSRALLDYDVDTPDHDAAIRAAAFITKYPNNYITDLLTDYGYTQTESMLVTSVDLDVATVDNYLKVLANTAAGIIYVKHETHESGLNRIEAIVDLLIDESLATKKLAVYSDTLQLVNELYEVEMPNEEA